MQEQKISTFLWRIKKGYWARESVCTQAKGDTWRKNHFSCTVYWFFLL